MRTLKLRCLYGVGRSAPAMQQHTCRFGSGGVHTPMGEQEAKP